MKITSNTTPTKILFSYCILLTLGLLYVLLRNEHGEDFGEISVARLNIVGENGNNTLVLSNSSLFPPPLLGGQTYDRATEPGGIVFYDEQTGNETGGVALTHQGSNGMRAIVLDYDTMDAIGMLVKEGQEGVDRNYYAGLVINDPGPMGKVGQGNSRISLENDNGTARLVFKDTTGTPRLALGVLPNGEVFFQERNENQMIVRDLIPENGRMKPTVKK